MFSVPLPTYLAIYLYTRDHARELMNENKRKKRQAKVREKRAMSRRLRAAPPPSSFSLVLIFLPASFCESCHKQDKGKLYQTHYF